MSGRWGVVIAVWSLAACSDARIAHDDAGRRRHHTEIPADAAARDASTADGADAADADGNRPAAERDASQRAGHDAAMPKAVDAAMPPARPGDAAPSHAGAPAPEREDTGDAGADVPASCEPARSAGKLLVVFDRSGSMESPWADTRLKRTVAVELLTELLTTLRMPLSVAGQFFPSRDPNACICDIANPNHWIPGPEACCLTNTTELCGVTSIEAADQIGFVSTDEFLKQLPARASEFAQGAQVSGTPIVTALTRADEALATIPSAERWAVLLITDASPNCNGVLADAATRLTAWQAAGVPTLVVSFATESGAMDSAKQLAAASGNRAPFEPTQLEPLRAELARILAAATCR